MEFCIVCQKNFKPHQNFAVTIGRFQFQLSPNILTLFTYSFYNHAYKSRQIRLREESLRKQHELDTLGLFSDDKDNLENKENLKNKENLDNKENLLNGISKIDETVENMDAGEKLCISDDEPSDDETTSFKCDSKEQENKNERCKSENSETCGLPKIAMPIVEDDLEAIEMAMISQDPAKGAAAGLALTVMNPEQSTILYQNMSICKCPLDTKLFTSNIHSVLHHLLIFLKHQTKDKRQKSKFASDFCRKTLISPEMSTFLAKIVTGWLKCDVCSQDSSYIYN